MRTSRGKAFVGGGIVAVVIGLASVAWACTPQPTLTAPTTATAPGERVTVSGEVVQPGPVRVVWGSSEGTVLASSTPEGRSFSLDVTVPQVDPGVYYLLLVPSEGPVARAAIEVAAAPGPASLASPARNAWATGERAGDAQPGDPMALGAGVLVAGLVALSAATLFVSLRRQRVPTTGEQPRV